MSRHDSFDDITAVRNVRELRKASTVKADELLAAVQGMSVCEYCHGEQHVKDREGNDHICPHCEGIG